MPMKLSHVCLGAHDLEATIAFWRELMGLEVAHEFRNPEGELYGVFLACGEGTFLEYFMDETPLREQGRFRHICLEVDDIEATATNARGLGHEVEVRRGRSDRVLQFFIKDNEGTVVEFQQHDAQSALRAYLERVD